jgi:hypothetical protein
MTQITTLYDLIAAAKNKRALTCPSSRAFKGPLPAAFVIHLAAITVHTLINDGLFIYETKAKKEETHGRE